LRFHVFLLSLFILVNCSRKHLAIFFDGVPPENDNMEISADSIALQKADLVIDKKAKAIQNQPKILSFHPDYQDKKCHKCHIQQKGFRLKKKGADLCKMCHIDYTTATPAVHGPVAAGFCMACHLPHKSQNENLLILPKDKICGYCHNTKDVIKNTAHKKMLEKTCLDCHYAHGGQTVLMLKINGAEE